MFLPLVQALRRRKVPVGLQEAVRLAQALDLGLHDCSLEGFYYVARAVLIHDESHLDDFDLAFGTVFRGVPEEALKVTDELLKWLQDARAARELSDEEKASIEALDLDELRKRFAERLKEQKERHDGGSHWIGTGGTSPFGRGGFHPTGMRVGEPAKGGGSKSVLQKADARAYRGYRSDVSLDVRQLEVALRKLRAFARDGGERELDIDATIDATARDGGELAIVERPPRRPNTRVILMMDVGGSMDPHAHMMSQLFTAAQRATHWKELRTYYFHNCIYDEVYQTEAFRESLPLDQLLHTCGKNYKLVLVGDALMASYELLGGYGGTEEQPRSGVASLTRLHEHFDHSAWLNPEPEAGWPGTTIQMIASIFPMFPLTATGLGEAVSQLTRRSKVPS